MRLHTLTLLTAGLAVGCEPGAHKPVSLPETGPTRSGTVTVGADQLRFAQIFVRGADGSTAQGAIGEDGRYTVGNVPVGEVMVAVNTELARGDSVAAGMAGAYQGPEGGAKKGRAKLAGFVNLKEQYFDPEKSGLKTATKAGENEFNITLPASARR
jgi:hypothetical protein